MIDYLAFFIFNLGNCNFIHYRYLASIRLECPKYTLDSYLKLDIYDCVILSGMAMTIQVDHNYLNLCWDICICIPIEEPSRVQADYIQWWNHASWAFYLHSFIYLFIFSFLFFSSLRLDRWRAWYVGSVGVELQKKVSDLTDQSILIRY